MGKRCLAAVVSVLLLLTLAVPALAYGDIGGKIEAYVSEHEATTAGMAVSVFESEQNIYTGYFGYADKEAGLAVEQDTVMEWGSATKLLVWVSVMQLCEQGMIDLEADIRGYLPEGFLTNLNYDTPITMINLMNHNAGFQDCYADLFVKERDAIGTLESALEAHKPEQVYEPGTVTAYSNWGVALAGFIVERVSGQGFDDYVREHIFQPLGMEHSALSADLSDNPWVRERRKTLQCYTADGELIPDCFYYITLYPAGMCTSTLGDFTLFAKALLNPDSPLFEKRETWDTLYTPTAYLGDSVVPSNYHGFWVTAYGAETIGHGGNTAGCSSYLLLDLKNGIGCTVMTNQSNETIYNYEMMELIFGKYDPETYFPEGRTQPQGVYRTARTVLVGPHKLMSLSFLSEPEEDVFWMTDGTQKICLPYTDFVRVSVWTVVFEVGMVILWAIGVLFSAAVLLVRAIRRRGAGDKWSALAAALQLATFGLLAAMAALSLSYAVSETYVWMIGAMGVVMVAMIAAAVYRFARKPEKWHHWAAGVFLLIAAGNIGYWNLFLFWKL